MEAASHIMRAAEGSAAGTGHHIRGGGGGRGDAGGRHDGGAARGRVRGGGRWRSEALDRSRSRIFFIFPFRLVFLFRLVFFSSGFLFRLVSVFGRFHFRLGFFFVWFSFPFRLVFFFLFFGRDGGEEIRESGSPAIGSIISIWDRAWSCKKIRRRCSGSGGAAAMALRAACRISSTRLHTFLRGVIGG